MHLILSLAFPRSLLSNLTAFRFLIGGALLLAVAAILLAVNREHRISLKRSGVSDELAIHLSRIADALDRIANQTRETTHLAVPPKLENSENVRQNDRPHHIAYSKFER